MMSRLFGFLAVALALFFAFALVGCSGGNSSNQPAEELVAQSFSEDCALCHRATSIADVEAVHNKDSGSPQGEITDVTIDGGTGLVTISFSLFDSENNLVPIPVGPGQELTTNSIRFTIAKLVTGAGGVNDWQSYINDIETKEAGDPGNAPDGTPTPDGTQEVQATAERASATDGVFTDLGNGNYTYQLSFDITNVTDPLTGDPIVYDATLTHRVSMQVSDNVANAFLDFVPNGDPVTITRDISDNASCNECHIKLGLHGGDRIQVEYCVTCHNPGSTDANSGNTVDFKVMVHKIHTGEDLPEVEAGGEYAIWGFRNSKHDYSTVVYPQDSRNCTKCHDGADAATTDGDNWKNVPSTAACTSCHETPDATEFPTFPNLTPAEIETAHEIPAQLAAAEFEYNLISVTDPDGGEVDPGDLVKVTFSVTDPTNGDAAYDIATHPAFTSATGGASRLAILIGWDATDYTHTGSGSAPAQPISLNPLFGGATDNLDGTYSITSTVAIPVTVTGSGVAAIEGHPAGDFDGDGTFSDRVPVTNVVINFPITDDTAEERRVVVDIDNCNSCHGTLSLHGNNRTNEPQVCVICHNADATDIEVRPGGGATGVDGKVEEAIDFKYMIHAIHAGAAEEHGFRENGIVVYGFRGSVNDYSHVRLPNGLDNLTSCTGCHDGDTFTLPIDDNVLPTTVLTGAKEDDPDDDKNITPMSSVCSSCHDTLEDKTHMSEQGGLFDFTPFAASSDTTNGSSEADLCGPGPLSARPAGHTTRLDCCSCHGFN
jgi:OmcA/MtrC family decaheme c-type cytochrome